MPGVAVQVHDAYVAGEGILHPAVLGLFTLVDLRGTDPEPGSVAQGEFLRFFAEAGVVPDGAAAEPGRALDGGGRQRRHCDDARRQRDGDLAVPLRCRTGLGARAEARGRTLGKAVVMTPWEGRWSNYVEHDGLCVPTSGEVAWLTPQGRRPYWRGEVAALRYEFAPQ